MGTLKMECFAIFCIFFAMGYLSSRYIFNISISSIFHNQKQMLIEKNQNLPLKLTFSTKKSQTTEPITIHS